MIVWNQIYGESCLSLGRSIEGFWPREQHTKVEWYLAFFSGEMEVPQILCFWEASCGQVLALGQEETLTQKSGTSGFRNCWKLSGPRCLWGGGTEARTWECEESGQKQAERDCQRRRRSPLWAERSNWGTLETRQRTSLSAKEKMGIDIWFTVLKKLLHLWGWAGRRGRNGNRTSLVGQWLRICLPVQGTRVRSLVWEDSTCSGATKPMCHSCWCPCT